MDFWLIVFAIVAQSLDVYSTCEGLKRGFVEMNPIAGQTCKRVMITKAAIVTPLLFVNNKWLKVGLIGSGTFGFVWNMNQIHNK